MAQKPQIQVHKKYAVKYTDKLVACLPMDDAHFIAKLSKHKLLPSDTYNKIEALQTEADKASYFLNHVIRRALDIGDTSSFDSLLSVMECCGHDCVEKLASKIKSKIDKAGGNIGPGMMC